MRDVEVGRHLRIMIRKEAVARESLHRAGKTCCISVTYGVATLDFHCATVTPATDRLFEAKVRPLRPRPTIIRTGHGRLPQFPKKTG